MEKLNSDNLEERYKAKLKDPEYALIEALLILSDSLKMIARNS